MPCPNELGYQNTLMIDYQGMCFTLNIPPGYPMLAKDVILFLTILFVPTLFYFATKGGFYNTPQYTGNGSAHGTVED